MQLSEGRVTAFESANILGALQDRLRQAGLGREMGALQAIYADELGNVVSEFAISGIKRAFSDIDLNTIEAIINFDIERVTGQVRSYIDDVRSVLMRNILTGETPDFRPLRDSFGTRLVSNLETEINTGLMAFNRSITTNKAKELGFDLFIYLGPDDQITRPFCQRLLSKDPPIYSLTEISTMDNDQGLPVLDYGGGYNCRHQWRPISEERATEQGWKS